MAAVEFTISALPGTDVWRKPPTTDVFNAPRRASPSTTSTGTLAKFHSARVSFLLPPVSSLTQYDQAGLLVSLTPTPKSPSPNSSAPSSTESPPKWIKTGVEIYNGLPRAATVACDAWADWSLALVNGKDGEWVTVEVVSGEDELGKSLWVYQVVEGGERMPLREICWPFGHGGTEAWEVRVEAYACRPSKIATEELRAEFRDFEVKWA